MPDQALIEQIEQKIPTLQSLVGTPQVDASEIETLFPGSNQAIDLVNLFKPGWLNTISYIYNERDEPAFGVFNPSLNKSLQVISVKEELDKRGFQTSIGPDNKLYAYSPTMNKEEIEKQMTEIYEEKEQIGGKVIGIDIERITNAANNMASLPGNESLTDQEKQNLKVAQLASIIAHEATHARGDEGEATPEQVQDEVLEKSLRYLIPDKTLNTKGKIHASGKDWYRKAQIIPFQWKLIETILRTNQERDIQAFPIKANPDDSLEKVLDNNIHTHDKGGYDTEDHVPEENLKKDQLEEEKPRTMEKLLEEKRPLPLIIPIPKTSEVRDKMIKEARWGSNLTNIGGPHVGGALQLYENPLWGDPFDANEINDNYSSIRSSGGGGNYTELYWRRRYNPLYSKGGICQDRMGHPYYNVDFQIDLASMEWRNRPQRFWDRQVYWPNRSDIAVVGDDKGSIYQTDDDNMRNFIVQILRNLGYYKSLVTSGHKKAVRIILDENSLQHALETLDDCSYFLFSYGNKYVLWILGLVDKNQIEFIEKSIREGENVKQINSFVGLSETIKNNVNKIFSKCKLLCRLNGINDTFAVGGFVRTLSSTKDFSEINDIDFTSSRPDNCLKLGGLLANDLGVYDIGYYHRTKTISFEYEGIKMDFRGSFTPYDIRPLLRQHGIETTPLNFDIYARDFTINSLIYSFMENKIYDVSGQGLKDLENKTIRTFFDPNLIIPLNPLIIARAILLNLRGFILENDLDIALKKHSQELFNGILSNERLSYEYEKIARYGEDGMFLIKEYGITKLKEIKDKVEKECPDFFKKDEEK